MRSRVSHEILDQTGLITVNNKLIVIEDTTGGNLTDDGVHAIGGLCEGLIVGREFDGVANNHLKHEDGLMRASAVIVGLGGGRCCVDAVPKASPSGLSAKLFDRETARLEDETNAAIGFRTCIHRRLSNVTFEIRSMESSP